MRRAMRDLGLAPDIILVSSARRTLQTLEALGPWDDTPLIEPMDALYLASGPELLAVLNGVAETARSVLLIGHNPGMHELAMHLAGRRMLESDDAIARKLADGYPTGALAEFVVPGAWEQLDGGSARLTRFVCPRDLPEMAA